jgi:serine protease Do
MIDINKLEQSLKFAQTSKKIQDPLKVITKKGLQSSCTIFVKHGKGGQNQWSGSGFHIGNGMVVTASHVVPPEIQNLTIDITFDDQSFYPATVYRSEPNFDAAIINCPDIADKIPSLQLGDSDTLEIGDIVVVISAPEGFHDTATYGRVSNTHMTLGQNAPSAAWQDFIFIDADIMEGSSGGMVLGSDGLVYGLIMGVTGQHAEMSLGESSVSPSNKIKQLLS